MQRVRLISLVVTIFSIVYLVAVAQTTTQPMKSAAPPSPKEFVAGSSEQVLRGAKAYDLVCSDCHGDSGLGLAEGRLSFHPDHQRCESCHKTFNAPTKANVQISEKNSFNLGEPPALRGDGVLGHFANASVLYSYIRAAMPRYDPGALSEDEYWDITAFLLEINGALPDSSILTPENAASLSLR